MMNKAYQEAEVVLREQDVSGGVKQQIHTLLIGHSKAGSGDVQGAYQEFEIVRQARHAKVIRLRDDLSRRYSIGPEGVLTDAEAEQLEQQIIEQEINLMMSMAA